MALEDALGPGPEEEAPAPAEPAAAPAPSPAASPDRPPGFVPHEALHEQREQNKRLAEEVRQTRERSERMEQTFQKLLSSLNEKPAPDPTTDPLGHFKHQNQTLERELGNISGKLEQFEKSSQQQTQLQQFAQTVASYEQDFRANTPDYDQAVKFIRDVRAEDFKELGLPATQINELIGREFQGLAQTAIAQGRSPAQAAYNIAKRYGYKPKGNQDGNSIATIAKGMEASKTLDGGGGTTPAMSLKDLSQLPDDQVDEIINDPVKWARLMGKTKTRH